MTLKFKFDWEIIGIGIVVALLLSLPIFGICCVSYSIGLQNFYDQAFMFNYTEYNLPIGIEAYYDAEIFVKSMILGGLLTLWIFLGIVGLFFLLALIDAF